MAAISAAAAAPIDAQALRSVFAAVPGPVSIITVGRRSERYGATVGSLISLSLQPPLIGFSMKRGSALLSRLGLGTRFGASVLAAGQEQTARDFASGERDRFLRTSWCEDSEVPRIDDGVAWLVGEVVARHEAGDHEIVVGRAIVAQRGAGRALLFAERGFHPFSPSPVDGGVLSGR